MRRKWLTALCGAILTFVLALAGGALAAPGPAVTVRVEGKAHRLLAPVTAVTHSGSITKGGTPPGACSAKSAAGALDVATHHHWKGKYNSSFGSLFIATILGETHTLSSPYYWSVWVNNSYAQSGVCGIKLHHGDRLLFAVEPNTTYWYPLALKAPGHASAGHAFTVKVVWFDTAGKRKPLAGAAVTGAGAIATTDSHGNAHVTATHAGTLVLEAHRTGYIRAAPVHVAVSG